MDLKETMYRRLSNYIAEKNKILAEAEAKVERLRSENLKHYLDQGELLRTDLENATYNVMVWGKQASFYSIKGSLEDAIKKADALYLKDNETPARGHDVMILLSRGTYSIPEEYWIQYTQQPTPTAETASTEAPRDRIGKDW